MVDIFEKVDRTENDGDLIFKFCGLLLARDRLRWRPQAHIDPSKQAHFVIALFEVARPYYGFQLHSVRLDFVAGMLSDPVPKPHPVPLRCVGRHRKRKKLGNGPHSPEPL